ncbi:MAG: transglutaminase-like domain-containing protein [Gammaproteobacteria bacterium]|nr:transglutaminase-like domain-containing protein [Gammaproteobacteria bacterium]
MDLPLRGALERFLDSGDDPVEGALIVAGIVDESSDANWSRDEIGRLADAIDAEGEVTPRRVVRQFAHRGFRGARKNYYDVDNSVLHHVLRTRRGIPISLGVVLIGIARRLGLDALGVNFPRHFLVTIDDLLVDPFAVSPTTVANCRQWLKENKVDEAGAFNIADARDIAMRMLNNVRMLVQGQGDYSRALEISDYQLMIVPDSYGLYVERADAWLGLRAPEMVVRELEEAVRYAPDDAIADRLRDRISQARQLKSVVN